MKAVAQRGRRRIPGLPHKEYASKKAVLSLSQDEIKVTRRNEAIEHTRFDIREHLSTKFIQFKVFEQCLQKLKQDNFVTLSGSCGSGKTRLGLELLHRIQIGEVFAKQPQTLVRLESLDNWEYFIETGKDVVLMLDNTFGTFHFDRGRVRKNIQLFENLYQYFKAGNLKLIIAIRSRLMREFQEEMERCQFFCEENVIEINPENELQNEEEKRLIFDTFLRYCSVQVTENGSLNIHANISETSRDEILQINPLLGFLQCCQLFLGNKIFLKRGVDFFLDPEYYFNAEIKKLALGRTKIQKVAFIILVYIMLNGGSVTERNITASVIQLLTDEFDYNPVNEGTVKEALRQMLGVYVNRRANGIVSFQHEIITKIVLKTYGDLQPLRLLQLCRIDVLCEFIHIESYGPTTGDTKFRVSQIIWDEWIHRSLNEIRRGNTSQIVSQRSLFHTQFTAYFVNDLLSTAYSKLTEDIFITSCKEDNYCLVRYLLRLILKRKSSKLRHIVSRDLLVLDGLRQASLFDSSNSVRVILDQFKEIRNRSLAKCFHIACSSGNVGTIETYLRQRKGITKDNVTVGLIKACQCSGRTYGSYGESTVKVILRNRRDLQNESVSQGFKEACKLGRHGTARVILNERRDLPVKMVTKGLVEACRCERSGPGSNGLKCVEEIIAHRKDLSFLDVSQGLVAASTASSGEKLELILKSRPDLTAKHVVKGLVESAAKGNSKALNVLLNYRQDIDRKDVTESLKHACRQGQNDAIRTILNMRPDLSLDDVKEGLVEACTAGHNQTVHMLLHERMDLTTDQVAEGFIAACQAGQNEAVTFIIEKRKDLTIKHLARGVMMACISNHADIVKLVVCLRPDLARDNIRESLMDVKSHDYIMITECIDIILQQKEL